MALRMVAPQAWQAGIERGPGPSVVPHGEQVQTAPACRPRLKERPGTPARPRQAPGPPAAARHAMQVTLVTVAVSCWTFAFLAAGHAQVS